LTIVFNNLAVLVRDRHRHRRDCGIAAGRGLSTTLLIEAAMIAGMIASAMRAIVLADASKFGHNVFPASCRWPRSTCW
jgi:DeoR/GlpR family transcriptional regulator of sugar metabolism